MLRSQQDTAALPASRPFAGGKPVMIILPMSSTTARLPTASLPDYGKVAGSCSSLGFRR